MKKIGQKTSLLFISLGLLSCSQVPDVPTLPGNPSSSIEQVMVGNTFTLSDAKNVFKALNKSGRLDSLKTWFDLPDSELAVWSDFFDLYFYQEGLLKDGALSVIEQRIDRKGFQELKNSTEKWKASTTFQKENDALLSLLKKSSFPTILKQNVPFLSGSLFSSLERTHLRAEQSYLERGEWEVVTPPTPEQGSLDALKLLQNPENIARLRLLGEDLVDSKFTSNLFSSLAEIQRKHKNSTPYEGFVYGLGQRLGEKETARLFDFFELLNKPSGQLFTYAQAELARNQFVGTLLGRKLDPTVVRAARHFILESIKKGNNTGYGFSKAFWQTLARQRTDSSPSESFINLRRTIEFGLQNLSSFSSSPTLFQRLPNILTSLIVTERIEDIARANLQTINSLPEENFQNRFLTHTLQVPSSEITLAEFDEQGVPKGLSPRVLADLNAAEELRGFKEILLAAVRQEDFGSRIVRFDETQKTLEGVLNQDLLILQDTHRIADAAGLLMPIVNYISTSSQGLSLEMFESPNMLKSILPFFRGWSLETWNRLDHFLFEVLEIGRLSDADKEFFLQIYAEDAHLKARAKALFDHVELLHTFNKSIQKDLPTAFEFFHTFLSSTQFFDRQVHVVASVTRFIENTQLVEANAEGTPIYPYVYGQLKAGKPISKLLFQLSLLTAGEREELAKAVNSTFSFEHLDVLETLSIEEPETVKTLVRLLLTEGRNLLPNLKTCPMAERKLLMRVLASGEFEAIWKFFMDHSSKENVRALTQDLRALHQSGGLKDATQLLQRIENPVLKKFARVVEKSLVTGEFEALLQAIENSVPNSH